MLIVTYVRKVCLYLCSTHIIQTILHVVLEIRLERHNDFDRVRRWTPSTMARLPLPFTNSTTNVGGPRSPESSLPPSHSEVEGRRSFCLWVQMETRIFFEWEQLSSPNFQGYIIPTMNILKMLRCKKMKNGWAAKFESMLHMKCWPTKLSGWNSFSITVLTNWN